MPVLGVITNNQHSVFQRNVIAGIREAAARRGYDLLIDSYAEDADHPQPITLNYAAMDGVAVIANAAPVSLLRAMFEAGIPLSLVSHEVQELPIPAVIADNAQGMAELAKHILEDCGCRRPVFIQGLRGQRDSDERGTAFLQELLRYNLTLSEGHTLRGDFDPEVAAHALEDLLFTGTNFDAVVASDYLMGIAAVKTLRAAGVRVPEEVAVVGFGDAPEAEAAGLTTVAANVVEQGRRAARQLMSQIDGLRIQGLTILSVRLIVRQTSVCGK